MSVGWLRELLIVGTGGFLGAVARYGLSGLVHKIRGSQGFPFGTLNVNVLGCLLIGVLAGMAESRNVLGPDVRLFLFLGLIGGFTTFSTFGFETMTMVRDADYFHAAANVMAHIVVGLGAVWIGLAMTEAW